MWLTTVAEISGTVIADIRHCKRNKRSFDSVRIIDSRSLFSSVWLSAKLSKQFLVYTHLVRNKSHRILLCSYIRHCAACHRFDNYLCYTLAFRARCKDKCLRKTQPVSVVAFASVCRLYRTDVNKNSNLSSFPLDSLLRCKEVETFVVFVCSRKSNLSRPLKGGNKMLTKLFSSCFFGILVSSRYVYVT